jgi:single-stranded-DNA-specific exonuclease
MRSRGLSSARWVPKPAQPEAEARLCRDFGMTPMLARLLARRGVSTNEQAQGFLEAKLSRQLRTPRLFRAMDDATERVLRALDRGERIGIFGDYDVDGISGSAVLVSFLRALGQDPALYIPNRVRDGYGLNDGGVRTLAEQGTKLMITVDCGGSSHREIGMARQSGIDSIVCDHHQVSGQPLPAYANLNPIEPDAGFPFSGLCGAGVAFYLAMGVRLRLRESGRGEGVPDLRRWLDLVALGTIADIVPMVEENRVMVKHGLREIAATTRPGMVALKQVGGVTDTVSTGVVGFRLAPRLNAGGRLADATKGVDLLTTDDATVAARLAGELDQENRARQAIEEEILEDALSRVEREPWHSERRTLVLASSDWHPGVIGIVASRLVERFHRPVVLIALDPETGRGRGSCRGIPGVHLYEMLGQCRDVLEGFGGHRMAAGLSIRSDAVDDLAERFEAAVRGATRAEDFVPRVEVDCELRFDEIDDRLMEDLERLEPFGPGNSEPTFLCRRAKVVSRRVVGESHLKLYLRQGSRALQAIAFRMGDAPIAEGDEVDLLAVPEHNRYAGGIQLRVKHLRKFENSGKSVS